MSKKLPIRRTHCVENFYPKFSHLKNHFDGIFHPDLSNQGQRFVWDYWHVPEQYTLLRTPAYHFFPKAIYAAFETHICSWGIEHLGCSEISPPWLSCYVDGCEQKIHADAPHGPWAFVYLLSDPTEYSGGETFLLRENVLRLWENQRFQSGQDSPQLIEKIPSKRNRLIVFDPRIPHGVTQVKGPHDVRKARLAIHGWFLPPHPILSGSLKFEQIQQAMELGIQKIAANSVDLGSFAGFLSVRLAIAPSGKVDKFQILANSIQFSQSQNRAPMEAFLKLVKVELSRISFPITKGQSVLTLPLQFDS